MQARYQTAPQPEKSTPVSELKTEGVKPIDRILRMIKSEI